VVKGVNSGKVTNEIEARHSELPLLLQRGETSQAVFFFPLSPSPRRVELGYDFQGQQFTLVVNTADMLNELHIGIVDAENGDTVE
jgi:hypothetical protein